MTDSILKLQSKILKILADKVDDFYLAEGTALSQYYFQHRISEDLDFFTQEYSRPRVQEIINFLSTALNEKVRLIAEQVKKERVRMAVYFIPKKEEGLRSISWRIILNFCSPVEKLMEFLSFLCRTFICEKFTPCSELLKLQI